MTTQIELNLTPDELYFVRIALERESARLEGKGLETSDKYQTIQEVLYKIDALSRLVVY